MSSSRGWLGADGVLPAIYHFTHVENLPGILRAGQLDCHRRSDCKVDIADEDIKAIG